MTLQNILKGGGRSENRFRMGLLSRTRATLSMQDTHLDLCFPILNVAYACGPLPKLPNTQTESRGRFPQCRTENK